MGWGGYNTVVIHSSSDKISCLLLTMSRNHVRGINQELKNQTARIETYEKWVKNKFNIYNSLFLNLPSESISNVGILIPLLHEVAKKGLADGLEPLEILDTFFTTHVDIGSETEKIEFMFNVI